MRISGVVCLVLFLVLWSSCRTDFDTLPSSGKLEFSKDTIFLDTIFTNISTSTYNLKVYNPTEEDITIPAIKLGLGENSRYRLNVDGIAGKSFQDIELLARDSLYIFIETTVDFDTLESEETEFLYIDAIEFDSGANLQKVPLVTLVKDAIFLFPKKNADGSTETLFLGINEEGEDIKVEGFFLEEENLIFSNQKPYVIYGYAAVPSNKTLQIEAGARVHFHKNSGLIVPEGASIQVNGAWSEDQKNLENEVVFEGDRLEPDFKNIPGQWGSIWLTRGSINNSFNYTTIKNATIGLWVDGNAGYDTPPLFLKNTQIYNSSSRGLLARTGHIEAENLVINNSGKASLHLSLGGKYTFKHATISNYWQQGFRQFPAVYIENELQTTTGSKVMDLVEANFSNCIIYGNLDPELLFNRNEAAAFNFKFENCLIKFPASYSGDEIYDFSNPDYYEKIILNTDPNFVAPRENKLMLEEKSAARDTGNSETALEVPLDILNIDRAQQPDLGAYEWSTEEN